MHRDRLSALQNTDELLGVGNGKSAGGDRLGAIGEILHARVRVAVVIGADRANDDRERALERGNGRALPPRRTELTVAGAVLRGHHVVIDEDDLAPDGTVWRGTEGIDSIEVDDLARDALRACRAAVAERGDRQLLREGRDDLGTLRPTRPHRHRERLDVDVGETHGRQALHGPVAGALLGLGRGEALADLGGQAFSDVPGIMVVRQRIVAQRRDIPIDKDRRRQRGDRLLSQGGGGGEEKGGEERTVHPSRRSRDIRQVTAHHR